MDNHEVLDQRPRRQHRRAAALAAQEALNDSGDEPSSKRSKTGTEASTDANGTSRQEAAGPSPLSGKGRTQTAPDTIPTGATFRGVSLADAEAALRSEEAAAGPLLRPDAEGDLPHISIPEFRSEKVGQHNFEYLDHTADIQIHSWGPTLAEAFEGSALGMYNYMTPLEGLAGEGSGPLEEKEFEAEGHDLDSLLFAFLDELLFNFNTDGFVCTRIKVQTLDKKAYKLRARGWGVTFDRSVHECGTEIKAITYSAMQILDRQPPQDCEVFVIVDI